MPRTLTAKLSSPRAPVLSSLHVALPAQQQPLQEVQSLSVVRGLEVSLVVRLLYHFFIGIIRPQAHSSPLHFSPLPEMK